MLVSCVSVCVRAWTCGNNSLQDKLACPIFVSVLHYSFVCPFVKLLAYSDSAFDNIMAFTSQTKMYEVLPGEPYTQVSEMLPTPKTVCLTQNSRRNERFPSNHPWARAYPNTKHLWEVLTLARNQLVAWAPHVENYDFFMSRLSSRCWWCQKDPHL